MELPAPILAFIAALPKDGTFSLEYDGWRVRRDPDEGARQQMLSPPGIVGLMDWQPQPLKSRIPTPEQAQAAHEAAKPAPPSDIDSLSRPPPVFYDDTPIETEGAGD